MLDRCAYHVLAALLLAFLLPLLAWRIVLASASTLAARLRDGSAGNPAQRQRLNLLKQQLVGEFAFDRAIEAYEYLIDSTYAEGCQ